ncbi:SIP domain-containing protein [Rhodococcus qingshengii]|uniref:SIP domain-containing protein n=1 Tax=Rhodococcus qingshengii TaxID=334542 RepID=A0AAW6LF29_RHOSG|nr:SIP domain-containing protein [Rhodococcus qingshengii]MDE8643921.1 SIP domain-containing protein [Rhodococcus qingshengii]
MTHADASRTTTPPTTVLRTADHNRGLNDVLAIVEAMERPSDYLLRITARLTESTDDPIWSRPNVTVRMNLGPAFDDASRVYTVRSYDSASGSIVVDVVLHGQTSPMMRWAATLAVGDTFGLTGPRPHFLIPDVPGRRIALFLDGTAIPALHSIIEQLPTDVVGIGWVTTDDEVAFAELPALPGLELHRVSADPAEPDGPLAVRARELANPASYVVWGAGERNEMRAIRKHFRSTVGLDKNDVAIFGYWREGVSNTEIDLRRRENYERILADGGTLTDIDDLAIEI